MTRESDRPPQPAAVGSVRVRLIVRGRVQGVWYRGSAREEALRLGIRGWARNRSDGSVEILAEGRAIAVDHFVAWCREGPPLARVTSLEREEQAPQRSAGDELARRGGFEVR